MVQMTEQTIQFMCMGYLPKTARDIRRQVILHEAKGEKTYLVYAYDPRKGGTDKFLINEGLIQGSCATYRLSETPSISAEQYRATRNIPTIEDMYDNIIAEKVNKLMKEGFA